MDRTTITRTVVIAIFTALIAAGAFIRIPIPPVPITLQTLFVLICGLLLPMRLSLASVGTYLFLGLVGLPVFTSGGGFAALTGPTGGYLVGLVPAVLVLSAFRGRNSFFLYLAGSISATVALYIPGLLWLGHSLDLTWQATLSAGLVPFIIGDSIKIVVASAAAAALREKTDSLLQSPEQ